MTERGAFGTIGFSLSFEADNKSPMPVSSSTSPPAVPARFLAAGDTALVIELGETVDRTVSAQVLALSARVEAARLPGVIETVPTFRSLMVHYDPLVTSQAQVKAAVQPMLSALDQTTASAGPALGSARLL